MPIELNNHIDDFPPTNPFVKVSNSYDFKPTKKKLNPRNDILKQIYAFYDTEQEVVLTKRANWKRYIETLKKQKVKDSQEQQRAFKKSKLFIRKMSPSSMAFFLSHIPTNDLWYILSVAKDKSFRNESVGAYIMGLQVKNRVFTPHTLDSYNGTATYWEDELKLIKVSNSTTQNNIFNQYNTTKL